MALDKNLPQREPRSSRPLPRSEEHRLLLPGEGQSKLGYPSIQKILQQDLVNPDHFMLANHVVTVRTGRPHGDMNARERRQTGRGPMDTHIW